MVIEVKIDEQERNKLNDVSSLFNEIELERLKIKSLVRIGDNLIKINNSLLDNEGKPFLGNIEEAFDILNDEMNNIGKSLDFISNK